MLLGRNASSMLMRAGGTAAPYMPGAGFLQRFTRTVHNICGLWRSHNAMLDTWLARHPEMTYIRVNAESFLRGGIRREVAIVNRVRELLGLDELGKDVGRDVRLKSWMSRKPNGTLGRPRGGLGVRDAG